jgi:hypothetical protein
MKLDSPHDPPGTQLRRRRRWVRVLLIAAVLYLLVAYLLIPMVWKDYARLRPSFDDNPRITQTSDGHPGDPLNVALIGSKEEVQAIMKAAKWDAAAALGVRSDISIGVDSVLSRPDDTAPVSNLFLFGRKEDLAFEQPVGDNPRQRNHVRFWKIEGQDAEGRPIWIGAASYDERIGFSHTTGQITHHISPDVDKERNHLFADLKQTVELLESYTVDGFHTTLEGRNGGGDKWVTDGDLNVGVIRSRIPESPTIEAAK